MSIFNKSKKGGIRDVIRCDEEDYLIWRWHPNGYESGKLKRETAIRTNSTLRVKQGEAAVFVYDQSKKKENDYILGPYDDVLKTKNFPILSSIIGLWYEGDTPFQAEVFFINLSKSIQMKFTVPFFDVYDPRYPDFGVPVAVRGTLTFKISDYVGFVKCHQLANFELDDLKKKVNDGVVRYIKANVASAAKEYNIPVVSLESKIGEINNIIESKIKSDIGEDFFIDVVRFDLNSIEIDKDSEGYEELKAITKNATMMKTAFDVEDYGEQLRINREESQYQRHMETKTSNLGAYQTEVSGEVGVAAAEALGKMGENGAGTVNMGDGSGFNPMAMMAGVALGSAVGKNMAGVMDSSLNNVNSGPTPPPIPVIKYYVAKDNKQTGPYETNIIKQMIESGEITRDTLLWCQGMAQWEKAENIDEFSKMFPPKL